MHETGNPILYKLITSSQEVVTQMLHIWLITSQYELAFYRRKSCQQGPSYSVWNNKLYNMENICLLKLITTDFPTIFTNFAIMDISYFAQICWMLWAISMSGRCHHRSALETPVNYECDIQLVTTVWTIYGKIAKQTFFSNHHLWIVNFSWNYDAIYQGTVLLCTKMLL